MARRAHKIKKTQKTHPKTLLPSLMRIRRSLPNTAAATSAADTSADPDLNDNLFATPHRCTTGITTTKTSSIIICVLNQSPWDVTDLSSLQLDGGLFSLTGTTPVPELAIGSQSFRSSVKLCGAASDKCLNRRGKLNSAGLSRPEVKIRAEKSSAGRKVVSSNKPQIWASNVKKQQMESNDSAPKLGMKRRGKSVKKSAANPNEFYYYSGFGPHWGKKRETVTKTPIVTSKVAESDQELRKTKVGTKLDIEFVDYDDDEDDINVEQNEEGKRRPGGRKRVKARSLKSLM